MDILDNIFRKLNSSHEMSVFCGAGISINSGLPSAISLIDFILNKLNINEKDKTNIVNKQLEIPFEVIMQSFIDNSGDIDELLSIYKTGKPNTTHKFIAQLVQLGKIKNIFTTNFDLLIEKALEDIGYIKNKDFVVYSNESEFKGKRFRVNKNSNVIKIFKLHGSIDDIDSIRTTISTIANKQLSNNRFKAIEELFKKGKHKYVLIFGYSLSDVFDIVPHIQLIEKSKKIIILIDHSQHLKDKKDCLISNINTNSIFTNYNGYFINFNTDNFIEWFWKSFSTDYPDLLKANSNWQKKVNEYIFKLTKCINGYSIIGELFYNISKYRLSKKYHYLASKLYKKNTECMVNTLNYIGLCYYNIGNYKYSLSNFTKALVITKDIKYFKGESKILNGIGMLYKNIGEFDKALDYCKKSSTVSQKHHFFKEKSNQLNNIGLIYKSNAIYNKAIYYYRKSLDLKNKKVYIQGIADTLGNIGNLYLLRTYRNGINEILKKRYLTIALKYENNALDIYTNLKYLRGIANTLNSIGLIYKNKGDCSNYLNHLKLALPIFKSINFIQGEAEVLGNLGNFYHLKGNYDEALEYQFKVIKVKDKIDKQLLALTYGYIGSIYKDIKDYILSEKYLKLSIEIYEENNLIYKRSEFKELLLELKD